jgi:hypothetical protein
MHNQEVLLKTLGSYTTTFSSLFFGEYVSTPTYNITFRYHANI